MSAVKLHFWINGQRVLPQGSRMGDVFNPATGEVIRRVPLASRRDIDAAVAAAFALAAFSAGAQAKDGDVVRAADEARRETIRYGTDAEIMLVVKNLEAEKNESFDADLLDLLENCRNSAPQANIAADNLVRAWPEVVLDTVGASIEGNARRIVDLLRERGFVLE